MVGTEARQLYEDALKMLQKVKDENLLEARAVFGFYPANSIEDDIEIYQDETRTKVINRFCFLREQKQKSEGVPNYSLADFMAPKETGIEDYMGFFAVSAGFGTDEIARAYEINHDDYHSILIKAISDRLAEAFAEYLHEAVRKDFWGYAAGEQLSNEELIREKYAGIRPAPGYPACPEHTEKGKIWELLDAESNTGIKLTESFAMWPAASVSGFYFSHPQSRYFGLGKIDKDQVKDYAIRKGMPFNEAEKWLAPVIGY